MSNDIDHLYMELTERPVKIKVVYLANVEVMEQLDLAGKGTLFHHKDGYPIFSVKQPVEYSFGSADAYVGDWLVAHGPDTWRVMSDGEIKAKFQFND